MSGEMVVASQIGGQEFALLKVNPAEIIEIIRENTGGDGLTARDLDRVKIPSGGGAAWELPSLEGGEVAKEFVGVVLLHKNARVFWKQGMEETGGKDLLTKIRERTDELLAEPRAEALDDAVSARLDEIVADVERQRSTG